MNLLFFLTWFQVGKLSLFSESVKKKTDDVNSCWSSVTFFQVIKSFDDN